MKLLRAIGFPALALVLASALAPTTQAQSSPPQPSSFKVGLTWPAVSAGVGSLGGFGVTGLRYFSVDWVVAGTISACTVTLDGASSIGGAFSTGSIVSSQNCASSGTFATSTPSENVQANLSYNITGSGSVTFTVRGFALNPASSSSGGGCIATVSTLSSSCGTTKGTLATVTDGTNSSDCTAGGGTNAVACVYNGTAWVFAGNSGSNPTFAQVAAGTNAASLVEGTGGSLTTSGTGVISANQVNAATVPASATLVGTNSSRQLVDASAATLANNTSGTAANLSGTPALPNGTTGTTQTLGDNTTKLATDAFVLANASGTVTNISTGTGLTGGPITNTGTVSELPATSHTQGGTSGATLQPTNRIRPNVTAVFQPGPFDSAGGGATYGITACRQWVTGTNYFGTLGNTGHADCVTNAGLTYRNLGASGVSGASAPTCGSGTCSDGTITWTKVGGCLNACVVDDFWNYVAVTHNPDGSIAAQNMDNFYGESDWATTGTNGLDSGTTTPNFSFTTIDSNFNTYLSDPSFPLLGKLEYGIKPVDGNAASSYTTGNIATPVYIFTQSYANSVAAANPNETTWQATGFRNSNRYWFGWFLFDGTNYELMTATGANAVCTPGGTIPTWAAVNSSVTDGTCTWKNVGTNAPLQDAGLAADWTASTANPAGGSGSGYLYVHCAGSGTTYGYYNLGSACLSGDANAKIDLSVAFPAAWEPPYFLGVAGNGGLYAQVIAHYGQAGSWANLFATMDFGQTKGVQNNYFTQSVMTPLIGTSGQFYTWWGSVMQYGYFVELGRYNTQAGFPISVTMTDPNNTTVGPAQVNGARTNNLVIGDNGMTANDLTAYTAGTPCADNWCQTLGRAATFVPMTSGEMLTTSTEGGGTSGALLGNMSFAGSLGITNYKVLPKDYMALSPNSSIYGTFGQLHLNAMETFRAGPVQSAGAGPIVDPVSGNVVANPVTSGLNLVAGLNVTGKITATEPTGSVWGSATGGAKGPGTINAQNFFTNGTAVGLVNSGTSGHLAYYPSSTNAVSSNSNLDDGASATNTLTYSGAGGIVASAGPLGAASDGTHAGILNLIGNTTVPATLPANSFGWLGPNSASFTKYWLQPSATAPSATGPILVGATSSSVSPVSYGTVSGNTTKFVTTTGALTNGDCAKFDASGNLIDCGGNAIFGTAYQTIASNGAPAAQRSAVNFISGSNATFTCVDNAGASRTDCTVSASSSAGARLDQITAATATNTINNADNAQVWNWSLSTASKSAFTVGENVASTATGTPFLLNVQTLASSTANPFIVTAGGTANGWKVDTTGKLTSLGSGAFDASGSTATNGSLVQVKAGCTSGADGAICYDSTGKLTHVRTNGADSSVVAATGTSTTTTQVLHATAVAGIGTFSTIATGDLPAIPLSGLATQAADTMVANMTAGTAVPTAVTMPTTAHGIWLAQGTASAPVATAAGATNTVLHGNTGADPTYSAVVGADMTNGTVTATQLAAQYSKGSCTEVWGGSGTSFAMTAGDDAIANNSCYNDSGVTRTITALKCRSDNAANTTVLTPTMGSAGTGTAILTGTVTCGNSYAYSATGTLNNTSWTTGTGIDPGMSTVGNATSIAMIVEYTY